MNRKSSSKCSILEDVDIDQDQTMIEEDAPDASWIDPDVRQSSADHLFQVLRDMFPHIGDDRLGEVWDRHRPNMEAAVCQLLEATPADPLPNSLPREGTFAVMPTDDDDIMMDNGFDWPGLSHSEAIFQDSWSQVPAELPPSPTPHRHLDPPTRVSYREKLVHGASAHNPIRRNSKSDIDAASEASFSTMFSFCSDAEAFQHNNNNVNNNNNTHNNNTNNQHHWQ